MSRLPALHVDILLSEDHDQSKTSELQHEVRTWLLKSFPNLKAGAVMTGLPAAIHLSVQEVKIDGSFPDASISEYYSLAHVELEVHCYSLHKGPESAWNNDAIVECDNSPVQLITLHQLPNMALHGVWDNIYLDGSRSQNLLNHVMNMMLFFKDGDIDPAVHNWNRLVLLHGPPGSGKTSLCRGLAQKLAIRGSASYTSTYLLEINANAVHSKYFGESGKEIAKAFANIFTLAEDPQTMVCVLVDEVETIAASRKHAHDSHEVGDALRATNQLLTALDKARFLPNVLVLCTSNLVEVVDSAFLSRVDIDEHIGSPSPTAAYDILSSCMADLVAKGKIFMRNAEIDTGSNVESDFTAMAWEDDAQTPARSKDIFPRYFHALQEGALKTGSYAARLVKISERCGNFSGRVLRRLPILALAKYTFYHPRTMDEALNALSKVVEEKKKSVVYTSSELGLVEG